MIKQDLYILNKLNLAILSVLMLSGPAVASGSLGQTPKLTGLHRPQVAAESLNSGRTASGGGFINNSPNFSGVAAAVFAAPGSHRECGGGYY